MLKGHGPCDSFYVIFLKGQNGRDGEQITGRQGLETIEEREVDVTTRVIFVVME